MKPSIQTDIQEQDVTIDTRQTMSVSMSAIIAWLCVAIFLSYQYVLRVLPNIMMPDLVHIFGLTPSEIGHFSSAYYFGYVIFHIPIALCLDRIGVKKVLSIAIACTSIGMLPFLYAHSWIFAIIGRLLVGIASSAAVVTTFKVIRIGFHERQFNRIFGVTVTIGILGAMYGGRPLDLFLEMFGWRAVVQFLVLFGLFFAAIVYFAISKKFSTVCSEQNEGIMKDLKTVCYTPGVLILSFAGGLMIGVLEGFADAWATIFFTNIYGLTRDVATTMTSLIFLSMCVGASFLGYVMDKVGKHYIIIILSGLSMLTSFILVLYADCNESMLYALMCIAGFASAYQVAIISKARSFVQIRLMDLAATFSNMVMMIFGSLFHNLIAFIMRALSQETNLDSQLSSQVQKALTYALTSIPVALIIAMLIVGYCSIRNYSYAREDIK